MPGETLGQTNEKGGSNLQISPRGLRSAKETRDERRDEMRCDPGKAADPEEMDSIARRF